MSGNGSFAGDAGSELLLLAQEGGARTIFVVGAGRNAGKTTTLRAIYNAACARGLRTALASIGRDSEEALGAGVPKPRLWLQPQTIFATARGALPRTPACRILKLSQLRTAAGALLYARTELPGFYDLVGPPTAAGLREVLAELGTASDLLIVDGAIDRIAAIAGSDGAIVVACGAAGAQTQDEAVDEVAGLAARLAIPRFDDGAAALEIEGALTAARVARLLAAGESRQIVVRDPTQIALSGKAARETLARLSIRCRRPLHVIAATVASIGPERSFEPQNFRSAVAAATGLPTYDVYRGSAVA
ncbi:MAG TPA: hypothetical protein VHR97_11750 [Candidatus Baltobacteraceae bacterium]|nr:hypothetical protein [Candidatus Baltobacteraceae bacterium]